MKKSITVRNVSKEIGGKRYLIISVLMLMKEK